MKHIGFMVKADRALASARLLLAAHDFDGACNRACYAMFDAARAALVTVGSEPETIRALLDSRPA